MALDVNTVNYANNNAGITAKTSCSKPSFGIKGDAEKLSGQPSNDKVDLQMKPGFLKDNIEGEIGGKDFSLNTKSNLLGKVTYSGTIDGKDYQLVNTHKGIKGNIGNKPVNIEYNTGSIKNFLTGKYQVVGTIGDEKVDMVVNKEMFSQTMTGTFKDKKVDLGFSTELLKDSVMGTVGDEAVNMTFKSNGLFKNGINIKGKYNGDAEFFPILMASYYANDENSQQNLAALQMSTMQ